MTAGPSHPVATPTQPLPDASVVIPCHNAARTLPDQLDSLVRQRFDGLLEIVLAENCSTDDTLAVAEAWARRHPQIRVVRADSRRGANYARNVGAAAARADLLLFCDADDVADPGWVAAMAAAATDGCVALGGYLEEQTINRPRSLRWRSPATPGRLPVGLEFLPFPVGANCGVRRQVFAQLGGFDVAWQRGGTEVEFFWRVQLAGYDICYVPEAMVHYRHREGLRPTARQYLVWGRSDVRLFRQFRHDGVIRPSTRTVLRDWRNLLRRLPTLRNWEATGQWLCDLAYRLGRLHGSLLFRTWFP